MFSNKLYFLFLTLSIALFVFGCEDSATDPLPTNSSIAGKVLFLDGTFGVNAKVELHRLSNNSRLYEYADESGDFTFGSLTEGDYVLRFRSTTYNIHTFEVEISLTNGENRNQNVYILYNMLDEQNSLVKSEEVFLIKFQSNGAKIGDNDNFVAFLSGTYFNDFSNLSTLAADIYECPDSVDWTSADTLLTPQYIRDNYSLVTSLDETYYNGIHEIRFIEDDIKKILSNPDNGFIFVRKLADTRELKIPCIDISNNDFGLRIYYKQ